jgi:hypothetical protein
VYIGIIYRFTFVSGQKNSFWHHYKLTFVSERKIVFFGYIYSPTFVSETKRVLWHNSGLLLYREKKLVLGINYRYTFSRDP